MIKRNSLITILIFLTTVLPVSADHGAPPHTGIAIQDALDELQAGDVLILEPDTVYDVDRMIKFNQDGIGLDCQGATLRRTDEIVTTLISPVSIGDTSFQVADASLFEVGQYVAAVKDVPNAALKDGEWHGWFQIISIVGNTIETNPWKSVEDNTYEVGDLLVSTFMMVYAYDKEGITIENCVFDGNRQNNDTWITWTKHDSLYFYGRNAMVSNSIFINSQGDNITVRGDGVRIINNTFENGNGAAIHCSDVSNLIFDGNEVMRVAEQADRAGHTEGAITISLWCNDVVISNNNIHDVNRYGISQFHEDMENWLIIGNTFSNLNGLWRGYSAPTDEGYKLKNLTFENNIAINVARDTDPLLYDGVFFRGKPGAPPIENVIIKNNKFFGNLLTINLEKTEGEFFNNVGCFEVIDKSGDMSQQGNIFGCEPINIKVVHFSGESDSDRWLLMPLGLILFVVTSAFFIWTSRYISVRDA